MKNTVLIIAHNEENNIEKCIKSILTQSVVPDRIVLIAHNCTDNTFNKAKDFPIEVYASNVGDAPIYARLEGLKHLSSEDENIFCIDGDATADKNWIKELKKILEKNILVGSFVYFKGNIFEYLSNISNYFFCEKGNPNRWIWGASFAFHGRDLDYVKEILEEALILKNKINLTRYAEDFWLALFLQKKGTLAITNKTRVTVPSKEISLSKSIMRNKENLKNGSIMQDYFDSLVF